VCPFDPRIIEWKNCSLKHCEHAIPTFALVGLALWILALNKYVLVTWNGI